MEITFRFNETDRAAVTMSGGKFTVNFNPVGPLVPPAGSRLNDNGSHVHPQASGGGLNVNKAHVHPPAVMELFADTTPWTAENFLALICTGEKGIGKFGKPLHYKGSIIHEVFPGYTLCGGDIIGGWEEPVANESRCTCPIITLKFIILGAKPPRKRGLDIL
ncbi:BnaA01g25460D [Brassica napus]|uniref:Peptidyl-prolyl cis-trans isomerase n=1 Tax=Brassica napus TaxID=3708 RepID=A0A078HHU9_BRANA|nr:unnamed protein product [Brassica napus]CDY37326.1 BnaA01g25460D [Brassica napus]